MHSFYELSNKQFLYKMHTEIHAAKPLTKEKIQNILKKVNPNQNKLEVWEKMGLPKSEQRDILSYIKHFQANIVVNNPEMSDRITSIQNNARTTVQGMLKGKSALII